MEHFKPEVQHTATSGAGGPDAQGAAEAAKRAGGDGGAEPAPAGRGARVLGPHREAGEGEKGVPGPGERAAPGHGQGPPGEDGAAGALPAAGEEPEGSDGEGEHPGQPPPHREGPEVQRPDAATDHHGGGSSRLAGPEVDEGVADKAGGGLPALRQALHAKSQSDHQEENQ